MLPLQIHLTLPPWIGDVADAMRRYASDAERVGLAIELSRHSADHGGGPFGAAVFDRDNGRLIAVGVNRVIPQSCSVAHAETMALMIAQQRLSRHRLNEPDGYFVLACSAQPCCQCYGATVWSGIDELLIGARSEDVEELTAFDEGPLPSDWIGELERRHISVRRDILREQARTVLAAYGTSGMVY
ncbi:MAG: nucleoside deaminase [Rhodanobacter sp.]|jgi:tRNA(Arg) A34 adenosine deaminase TadA|nr:nucleoside deaminase [Rhodanobacter sp.]